MIIIKGKRYHINRFLGFHSKVYPYLWMHGMVKTKKGNVLYRRTRDQ